MRRSTSHRSVSPSGFDRALVEELGDASGERERRASVALSIQTLLDAAPTAAPGVSGIRVYTSERDACLAALREGAIFAPVHWRDGDGWHLRQRPGWHSRR